MAILLLLAGCVFVVVLAMIWGTDSRDPSYSLSQRREFDDVGRHAPRELP